MESKFVFNWSNFISGFIGAVIGAMIGISPYLIEKCAPGEIKGKIISIYSTIGTVQSSTFNIPTASIFCMKLSLISLKQDFSLKDIDIYIKYPSNKDKIKCVIHWWRKSSFVIKENGKDVSKQLFIPNNEYLLLYSIFPENINIIGYITFFHKKPIEEGFEYIEFIFIDFKNKKKVLRIFKNEIEDNKLFFDDEIWR